MSPLACVRRNRATLGSMRALPGLDSRFEGVEEKIDGATEQRRRIIAAAVELFSRRGYHDTTIERIVRRGRVGYQTFYRDFADKEACFLAVFEESAEAATERVSTAYSATRGAWPEKAAAAIASLFEAIQANPARSHVCLVESLTAGPRVLARYEQAVDAFAPILRPGRAFNPRNNELPDTLERTIAGGVLWVAYQRLILHEADRLGQDLPETIEFVLTPYIGEAEAVRASEGHFAPPEVSA